MSFATQSGKAESADSTANNGANGEIAPRPITSRYVSLKAHLGLLKDAIGATEKFGMGDTHLPAVKWAQAVEDALYNDDGSLGEQQSEVPYTVSEFTDAFGMAITTDHADLEADERTELKELFRNSDNHDVEDAKGQFKLPVINGERLPLLVADDDVLEEAQEMLQAILDEDYDNDAGSTPDIVESDVEFSVLKGTLDDLEEVLDHNEWTNEDLQAMLEAEKDGKDREGGTSLIESAIDAQDEENDDTNERSTESDGMTDEEKQDLATTVATAVVEALNEN